MAIRKDEVQIRINFLTDESRQFAKTIVQTEKFRKNIFEARNSTRKLEKELKKTNLTNGRRAEILAKIAANEKKVAENLREVARSGKAVEGIDLSKLMPSQLTRRAKQLSQTMRLIPQSAPEYQKLESELKDINDQLATARARTRGVAVDMKKTEGRLMAGMKRLGATILATFAIDRLIGWGKELFRTGIKMDALARKARTVLGKSLNEAEQAAKANAEAMGLTRDQYVGAVTDIADFLKPMGFSTKAASDQAIEMQNLAGALSEWSNGQYSSIDVSNSFRKALVGEREELERYGISIKQSDVNTRLAEKGLKGLTGQSKKQAEALATLELITESSTDAQRAYTEGAGTAVRTQAELSAKIAEIKERLAQGLMPVFAGFVGLVEGFADLTTDVIGLFDGLGRGSRRASENVALLQAEFNREIKTLERGNLSQENRNRLIGDINNKFKNYLPNLIEEGDSLATIAEKAEEANKAFIERINLLAAEERLKDISKKKQENIVRELELQRELTAAEEQLRKTRSQDLAALGQAGSGLLIGAKQNVQDLTAAIADNKEVLAEVETEFNDAIEAARIAGADLDKILNPDDSGPDKFPKNTLSGLDALKASIKELEDQLGKVEGADAYVRITQRIAQLTAELNAKQREFNDAVLEANGGTISPETIPVEAIEDAGQEMLQILDDLGVSAETAALSRQQSSSAQLLAFQKRAAEDLVRLNIEKNQRITENEQRSIELRKAINKQAEQASKDALDAGIELLSKDEEARKKNAGAIKAFQIGKVTLDGIKEVQGIFASFSSLLPGGQIIAAIQAAIAIARTGAAIRKIKAQKFAGGGKVLSGKIKEKPNIPTQPNGDSILARIAGGGLATIMPGEVILNAKHQAALGGPTVFQRIGIPGFATGGTVPNTTPTPSPAAPDTSGVDNAAALAAVASLENKFEQYAKNVENWQRQFRVNVSYLDIEEAGTRLADVREDASL